MRTNIVLDDKLLKQAFSYSKAITKTELIHLALYEFVENHSKKDVRQLLGKVKTQDNYDYKSLRKS